MKIPNIFLDLIVIAIWSIAVPAAFVVLYSVVELQSAARSVAGSDSKLANLQVIALSTNMDRDTKALEGLKTNQNEVSKKINALMPEVNSLRIASDRARGLLRSSTLEMSSLYGLRLDRKSCVSDVATLTKCQVDHDATACAADWGLETDCYQRALSAAIHQQGGGTPGSPIFADIKELRGEMAKARDAGYDYNAKVKDETEFVRLYSQYKGDLDRENNDLSSISKDDKSASVANGYLELRSIPGVKFLFLMPPGVSVALFTAVMAAIAAAVGGLVAGAATGGATTSIATRLLIKPAVGALAGFTVFFVVSAGASFLVQPSGSGAVDAVNNLSASALGALGIFAGLSADAAVTWLKSKAASFFKV